ncbi:unnamed protein product [Auanema sp. JU1783]|nr:unnamed protein product [Auanema sp. JU1783]
MSSEIESANNEYATQIEIGDISNSRLTTEVMEEEQIPKLPTTLPPKKLIEADEIPKKEHLSDSEDVRFQFLYNVNASEGFSTQT